MPCQSGGVCGGDQGRRLAAGWGTSRLAHIRAWGCLFVLLAWTPLLSWSPPRLPPHLSHLHMPRHLAERFVEIVKLRNKLARVAGYQDYYDM